MNATETQDTPMKAARLNKGWTQRKLAAVITAAGTPVSDGNLSRIESGKVSPSPALRRAIADALDLKTTDIP